MIKASFITFFYFSYVVDCFYILFRFWKNVIKKLFGRFMARTTTGKIPYVSEDDPEITLALKRA